MTDFLERLIVDVKMRLRFMQTRSLNLIPQRLVNIDAENDGSSRFSATANDPQIHFQPLPLMGAFGSALVEIDLKVTGQALISPVIYVRRQRNFAEADRLPMVWIEENRLAAFIPNIANLDGIRFDPSDGKTDFVLNSASLKAVHDRTLAAKFESLLSPEPAPDAFGLIASHLSLTGVGVVGASGLQPGERQGEFTFTDNDPQMIFALKPSAYGTADCLMTELVFRFAPDGNPVFAPRIYLEYRGEGFSQESSFPLALDEAGECRALIALPGMITRIRWDPSDRAGTMRLASVSARPIALANLPPPVADVAWGQFGSGLSVSLNTAFINGDVARSYDYTRWLKTFEAPAQSDYTRMKKIIRGMKIRPKFSFIMPTYNTPVEYLDAAIRSMLDQVYPDFEICIADDCSTDPKVRKTLERWAAKDARIRVEFRETNGHISRASNSAIALATGDFAVLMDHDDLVPDYALFVTAVAINANPEAKILFSDEDKLSPDGKRIDPYFKSNFNDFLIFGHNMISHLGVYEMALVRKVRGFRVGYEGSQDYDLFLRCSEKCAPDEITHIPHVLYHWRMLPGSTAMSADQKSYAIVAAQKALNSAFKRRGLPLRSIDGVAAGLTGVEVEPPIVRPKVSIVIPTRDGLDLLRACLDSLALSSDANYEVIIVDNGSVEHETKAFLTKRSKTDGIKVISAPGPFNFSTLCNLGVEAADGDIICLLNNDTELLAANWLDRARGLLSIPSVGAVGARLLYPDNTVQHFGLTLGMGGHGIAGTPHRGLPANEYGPFGKARLLQEFSAVTAACMFVRRSDYLAVGGFDSELAVAYNDVDFCLKLRKQGLKVVCDPDILLIHKESKTRGADTEGARAKRLERESALMHRRWGDTLADDPYYSPNLTLSRDDFSLSEMPRATLPWRAPVAGTAAKNGVPLLDTPSGTPTIQRPAETTQQTRHEEPIQTGRSRQSP